MVAKPKAEPAVVVEHRTTLKPASGEATTSDMKPAAAINKIKLTPLTGRPLAEPATEPEPASPVESVTTEAATAEPAPPDDKQIAAHEARLQRLITDETYYLPINQVEKRRTKRYVAAGVICIVVLGLAWADVALDAGILTIPGLKAPTHFFH